MLKRDPVSGIGLTLAGGTTGGVFVASIIPGGSAEKEGSIKAGDRLVAINGRSTECELTMCYVFNTLNHLMFHALNFSRFPFELSLNLAREDNSRNTNKHFLEAPLVVEDHSCSCSVFSDTLVLAIVTS